LRKKEPCNPLECNYEGASGRCSKADISGWTNVGEQNCKDGCECYIYTDQSDCDDERKCERPDAEAGGFNPTGHCRRNCDDGETEYDTCDINNQDDCSCCLRKKEPCNPLECNYEGASGRCSKADISGWTNVGEQNCKDGCECYIYTDPCNPLECNYKQVPGRCSRVDIPGSTNVGEQDCKDGCECYLPKVSDCGPACESVKPTLCMCMINGNQCPDGFCHYDSNLCDPDHCTCCKETSNTKCVSKNNMCSGPDDYCVEKLSSKCPKGFAKVLNACIKSSILSELEIEKIVAPEVNETSKDCDCCKSLECVSNGDACSGKGQYCIDSKQSCPSLTHTTTFDCHKPVVENGVWIQSKLCKCCKLNKIVVAEELLELEKPVITYG